MSELQLDFEGRYVQGPTRGKANWLCELGAKRRPRAPRKFPGPEGTQYVAVISNAQFDAALWVQDDIDFERCKATDAPVIWLEMPSELLHTARRREPGKTLG